MGQLHIGGERQIHWYRMEVQGTGLLEIDFPGDVPQINADGALAADQYYYGFPWYVDTDRLQGELLGVSQWKDDHYYEHHQSRRKRFKRLLQPLHKPQACGILI